jgi:hypothetical protein
LGEGLGVRGGFKKSYTKLSKQGSQLKGS